jgi:antitoxin (DNA-binding transcriptional repressor) of toxin-antitoxin stability system
MRTMTVRDVRLNWPEAERQLAAEGEIVVTRDSKPVARLLPYTPPGAAERKRFDPAAHLRWLRKFWAGKPKPPNTDDMLARDRAD